MYLLSTESVFDNKISSEIELLKEQCNWNMTWSGLDYGYVKGWKCSSGDCIGKMDTPSLFSVLLLFLGHLGSLHFVALLWQIWAATKFCDYLFYPSTFTVYTDNNPLTYVLSTARLNAVRTHVGLGVKGLPLCYKV